MTGRPELRLVESWERPPRPRWRHWWFKVREAAGDARWHLLRAAMAAVATAGMRRRAWAAGFALALGDCHGHFWLSHLDEYDDGNEAGRALHLEHRDPGRDGASTRRGPAGLVAAIEALTAAIGGRTGRAADGICRPFALPDMAALAAVSGQPVTTLPPLVAPRPIVASAGRHVAPGGTAGRPAGRPGRTAPRHARRTWRTVVREWLSGPLPGLRRDGALRAA